MSRFHSFMEAKCNEVKVIETLVTCIKAKTSWMVKMAFNSVPSPYIISHSFTHLNTASHIFIHHHPITKLTINLHFSFIYLYWQTPLCTFTHPYAACIIHIYSLTHDFVQLHVPSNIIHLHLPSYTFMQNTFVHLHIPSSSIIYQFHFHTTTFNIIHFKQHQIIHLYSPSWLRTSCTSKQHHLPSCTIFLHLLLV